MLLNNFLIFSRIVEYLEKLDNLLQKYFESFTNTSSYYFGANTASKVSTNYKLKEIASCLGGKIYTTLLTTQPQAAIIIFGTDLNK